jgi:hypothetical protein
MGVVVLCRLHEVFGAVDSGGGIQRTRGEKRANWVVLVDRFCSFFEVFGL